MGNKKRKSLYAAEQKSAYLFILPMILQLLIFTLGAILFSFGISFTDWSLLKAPNFVGLENYIDIFKDRNFRKALYNTFFYMLGIPLNMSLALLIAMALNTSIPGKKLFRVAYYLPVVSSAVAIAILWKWLYNPQFGLINTLLQAFFKIEGPAWLGSEMLIKPSVIIMNAWTSIGTGMVLYLAALQNVPLSLFEAADIDGAGSFRKFISITMPMLTPTHFYVIVTSIIGSLQSFTSIYILVEKGGPNYSAATLVYYLWEKAFRNYQMGFSTAVSIMLALLIFIITLIQFKYADKWVYNEE